MKAIILASGAGTRLRPLTDRVAKPLLKVGDKTILDYQLGILLAHSVSRVVITTGHLRERVEEHVSANYNIRASFVNNPIYQTTNYIYSLWLVRDLIDDDILLLHGDLLFDAAVVARLMEAEGNHVLVNRDIEPPEKDFKALVEDDQVMKIGVELSGPNAYFCAPMYKFTRAGFLHWLAKIDEFVRQGKTDCYAEDAFNEVSRDIVLRPLYFREFCMEIDTMDDLEKARRWSRNRAAGKDKPTAPQHG